MIYHKYNIIDRIWRCRVCLQKILQLVPNFVKFIVELNDFPTENNSKLSGKE